MKFDEENMCVYVNNRQFTYDSVFDQSTDNDTVYMNTVKKLVDYAFEGFNCTVFLYGQTGTGKTYTHSSLTSSAFAHIFSLIKESEAKKQFLVRSSYCELYNENIFDLLVSRS